MGIDARLEERLEHRIDGGGDEGDRLRCGLCEKLLAQRHGLHALAQHLGRQARAQTVVGASAKHPEHRLEGHAQIGVHVPAGLDQPAGVGGELVQDRVHHREQIAAPEARLPAGPLRRLRGEDGERRLCGREQQMLVRIVRLPDEREVAPAVKQNETAHLGDDVRPEERGLLRQVGGDGADEPRKAIVVSQHQLRMLGDGLERRGSEGIEAFATEGAPQVEIGVSRGHVEERRADAPHQHRPGFVLDAEVARRLRHHLATRGGEQAAKDELPPLREPLLRGEIVRHPFQPTRYVAGQTLRRHRHQLLDVHIPGHELWPRGERLQGRDEQAPRDLPHPLFVELDLGEGDAIEAVDHAGHDAGTLGAAVQRPRHRCEVVDSQLDDGPGETGKRSRLPGISLLELLEPDERQDGPEVEGSATRQDQRLPAEAQHLDPLELVVESHVLGLLVEIRGYARSCDVLVKRTKPRHLVQVAVAFVREPGDGGGEIRCQIHMGKGQGELALPRMVDVGATRLGAEPYPRANGEQDQLGGCHHGGLLPGS